MHTPRSLETYQPSTYIVEQNAGKYGGQQENYQLRSGIAIARAVELIKQTSKTESVLIKLFFTLLENFEAERAAIAKDHGTPHAERFGCRRDQDGKKDHYFTYLDHEYTKYNPNALAMLADAMKSLELEKKIQRREKEVCEDEFLGFRSTFEIEIIEGGLIMPSGNACPSKPSERLVELMLKREEKGHLTKEEGGELREALRQYKLEFPEQYKQSKLLTCIEDSKKEFPSPQVVYKSDRSYELIGKEGNLKSLFVLGTLRLPVTVVRDGQEVTQHYAVSQYLTWLYRDFRQEDISQKASGILRNRMIERMKASSTVMIMHQDIFLINQTLQETAKIFARTICWDRKNVQDIKDLLVLFRYYFAHPMPDERGSAAICEWFETAICSSHDYEIEYSKGKSVDLEALTTSKMSEFAKKYDSLVTIKPKQSEVIPPFFAPSLDEVG